MDHRNRKWTIGITPTADSCDLFSVPAGQTWSSVQRKMVHVCVMVHVMVHTPRHLFCPLDHVVHMAHQIIRSREHILKNRKPSLWDLMVHMVQWSTVRVSVRNCFAAVVAKTTTHANRWSTAAQRRAKCLILGRKLGLCVRPRAHGVDCSQLELGLRRLGSLRPWSSARFWSQAGRRGCRPP